MTGQHTISRLLAITTLLFCCAFVSGYSDSYAKQIAKEEDSFAEAPPSFHDTICPRDVNKDVIDREATFSKYHSDDVCDRVAYNQFTARLGRFEKHQQLKAFGTIHNIIPNAETIVCPLEPATFQGPTSIASFLSSPSSFSGKGQPLGSGLNTLWIVENRASTPIVVSFVHPETGLEVSAINSNIFPAIRDPNAVLQPGQWRAIQTFEGHEFIARAILDLGALGGGVSDNSSPTLVAGHVLLQHRVGLVPVGANVGPLSCSTEDNPPVIPDTDKIVPEFARTKLPTPIPPCNRMILGFRNVANCPLHAYYVTSTTGNSVCSEQFKFHLGVQHSGLSDYMWDWTSTVKYEGSFVGHSFVFRLASNPNVVVDTITIEPTYVRDCPLDRTSAIVAESNIIGNADRTGLSAPTPIIEPDGTVRLYHSSTSSKSNHLYQNSSSTHHNSYYMMTSAVQNITSTTATGMKRNRRKTATRNDTSFDDSIRIQPILSTSTSPFSVVQTF